MKKTTNQELKKAYLLLNELYFSNKLPKDLDVRYGKLERDILGHTIFLGDEPTQLTIHKRFRASWAWTQTRWTLFHEMCHLKLGWKVSCQGKRGSEKFTKEFMRLARAGAFNRIF